MKVIGVTQDALIPISEQKDMYQIITKCGKNVSFVPINDEHGHDAMFNAKVCKEKFAPIISSFVEAEDEVLKSYSAEWATKRTSAPTGDVGSFTRTIMGVQAAKIIDELPFQLPCDSWLKHIGNTPTLEVEEGMFAKLEGTNPGGSIKDRALTALLLNKFVTGELHAQGSTLALPGPESRVILISDI